MMRMAYLLFLFCSVSIPGLAQFTTLASFDNTDGSVPGWPGPAFVEATNGNLYGTTIEGGANDNQGTVFEMMPAGELVSLYSFCSQTNCVDGAGPSAGLMQATNGYLYGATSAGGTKGYGTVFQITPAGKLTTLYSFCGCGDGGDPIAGLLQGSDGRLYGTTAGGGAYGEGTVFRITTKGKLTTLASFDGTNGADPGFGPLIQGTDGNFYGTTLSGGASSACDNGCGTVFRMTPSGQLTTVYSFCAEASCADGAELFGGVVQGADGNLYGVTALGGANNYGTVFKLTTGGALTTLHSFDFSDGAYPEPGLTAGTDGNFYGTTPNGGAHGSGGTLFVITPEGAFTTLYVFCSEANCADGDGPFESLVQATNGDFYGATFAGGTSTNCGGGCGATFSLSTGLAPFVETRPSSGEVGLRITILGNNLKGATAVSFNGVAASFRVASSTEIRATVPLGATTGTVSVSTRGGTLESSRPFYVTP